MSETKELREIMTLTENQTFRAAQYVRMSTEHQQYSTLNQADKIREYADKRGIEIVRTYADDGKSGLSIGGRASLQRLIADVESGNTDFKLILVYDVSRWGRFQDADESAYYEYICKRKGISVAYVAEQFENDGSPVSTIVKGVKRAMAGEYSRELSAKVFAGQCRLIELGFRQGGPAGFGLRRVLIDQTGAIKATLKPGEHKSLQTDRVILVPGPAQEVATVHQIYRWLVDDDLPLSEIAQRLNDFPIYTDRDCPWTYSTVRQVLTNEKYIGNNVYNRHSFKLKKKHVDKPTRTANSIAARSSRPSASSKSVRNMALVHPTPGRSNRPPPVTAWCAPTSGKSSGNARWSSRPSTRTSACCWWSRA